MFVTHLWLRLGLVVTRTVKFSQEEFQNSSFQIILPFFPVTFPPTCGPELTTGELQQLSSCHNHVERVIPTYPALHLFSWQMLHVIISKVCIFLNLDHIIQSWVENIFCWLASWESSWNTSNISLNYDTIPIFSDIQDYYVVVVTKKFNTVCESLEMAMLMPFYSYLFIRKSTLCTVKTYSSGNQF